MSYFQNKKEEKSGEEGESSFVCQVCGALVVPQNTGSRHRNHCPFCLYSKHVDVNPGDRAAECGGLMKPIAVAVNAKKGMIITHKCTKCGAERNNKMQSDDNTELLIRLTNPYNREED